MCLVYANEVCVIPGSYDPAYDRVIVQSVLYCKKSLENVFSGLGVMIVGAGKFGEKTGGFLWEGLVGLDV